MFVFKINNCHTEAITNISYLRGIAFKEYIQGHAAYSVSDYMLYNKQNLFNLVLSCPRNAPKCPNFREQ